MATPGPVIGMPSGQKPRPRVDFKQDKFIRLIENAGIRICWSRGAICPCAPANDQTDQPDPNCTLCAGTGFFWFRPTDYVVPDEVGDLTAIQEAMITRYDGVVIRGVVQGVIREESAYDVLGDWAMGSYTVTVRNENRLGYYDRLVAIDAIMPFSQIVFTVGTKATLRYPAENVNLCRSEATIYDCPDDFELDSDGNIEFKTAPTENTRLSVHYDHHPAMVVWEHLHAFRDSLIAFKQPAKSTPMGNPQRLPLQVLARLEFLPFPRAA